MRSAPGYRRLLPAVYPLLSFLLPSVLLWVLGGASTFCLGGSPPSVSYRKDVQPILKKHCLGCHAAPKPKGKLSLETVADMRRGGRNGPLFQPGKPDASLLLESVSGPEPSMPKKEPPLPMDAIRTLHDWIAAGAVDDSAAGLPAIEVKVPGTYTFAPAVTSVALSADGKRLVAACRSELVLVDVEGKAPPRRVPTSSDLLTHVELSPDGKVLAVAGGSPGQFGEVRFLDSSDGKLLSVRRFGKDTLFRGTFLPDGKAIALGGPDGAVHVVPVDARQPMRRFELHSDWVLSVACTPDGKMLVTGGRDRAIRIASAQTGELLRTLNTSTDWIAAVAASDLVAVSAGRTPTLIAHELPIALAGIPLPGGKPDPRPINRPESYARPFEAPPGQVQALAVSGDRKVLAVAGSFAEVRVYQLASRQRTALIGKVPAPVYALALNAAGSRLALGSKSGEIQVYELPAGKLVKSLVPVPVAAPPRPVASR